MKFSALASLYSGESPEYLDQALESLHKQTLQADEIVIVHDGPLTNELYSCLEKWKQWLPIKEVKLKKNGGQALGRNAGLKKCTHDVVAILDTDDINHPKRFEIQIKHLEKNPKISVLGTWAKIFETNINNVENKLTYPTTNKEIQNLAINSRYIEFPVLPASVIYSRKQEILSVGGYPEKFRNGYEDYTLFFKIIEQGYIFENIPECLYYYRKPYKYVYYKYVYLNGKLKVFYSKRYGFVLACQVKQLYKIKRKLGMTPYRYQKFFTTFVCLEHLIPISISYPFRKSFFFRRFFKN